MRLNVTAFPSGVGKWELLIEQQLADGQLLHVGNLLVPLEFLQLARTLSPVFGDMGVELAWFALDGALPDAPPLDPTIRRVLKVGRRLLRMP